ncbi:unnamed protein product [Dracunculus medinensis]|uniref:Uncharacterized protein n=1 Tax=Dracunculus medinensis TaxID=318479 RepID=A0A0N4UES5_DRAME|nr:unnamed protein product [Dracunculus medinensis]
MLAEQSSFEKMAREKNYDVIHSESECGKIVGLCERWRHSLEKSQHKVVFEGNAGLYFLVGDTNTAKFRCSSFPEVASWPHITFGTLKRSHTVNGFSLALSQAGAPTNTRTLLNAFEVCERESIRGDGSLLFHADFLIRLNFFAERFTEKIAELAATDLIKKFKSDMNPRAIYFTQSLVNGFHQEISSEFYDADGRESTPFFEKTLNVSEPETNSPSWFSAFSFRDDSKFLPFSYISNLNTSRKSGDSSCRICSDTRSDFIDLVRRASGVSSNNSEYKVPETALVGLSATEKEHIIKVNFYF